MKIWIKYLIAAVVGAIAGLVIPGGSGAILDSIAGTAIHLGSYILLPMIFFSAAVATYEAHEDKRFSRIWFRTVGYSVFTVVLASLVGLAGAFIFTTGRIPLSTDVTVEIESLPGILDIIGAIVPADSTVTLTSFNFILPATFLAMILGLALSFDSSVTKPVSTFFDSMSRITWQINSFFVEILPLPLIIVSMARLGAMANNEKLSVFNSLFTALAAETGLFILILLPLALLALDRKRNPYKVMAALIAPALVALLSGHTYTQAGVAAKHLKESLGVRRRSGAVSLPLALAFGRAGTAMVTATAFVAILNSYSNLGLGSSAVFWMMAMVPMTALVLGAAPGSGPIVALAALCAEYGRGFESGYILLAPAILPLGMIAALIDSVCMSVIIAAVGHQEGYARPKDLRHFI
jgi:Na+/H+-dicarboxylate symporter